MSKLFFYVKITCLLVLGILSCKSAFSASLLTNGGIELGSFLPITGSGITSAADNFSQFSNSGSGPTTELLTDAEIGFKYGTNVIEGDNALLVTTSGTSDGLFSFNSTHSGWSDTSQNMTFSAWVYVISGDMFLGLGSNPTGFQKSLSSTIGEWEFISVSNQGSLKINNEILLYSNFGSSTFLVDSLWLNTGLTSEHPIQPSLVPVPTAVWLFYSALIGLFGMRKNTLNYTSNIKIA